jgi:hypothetical protein
MLPTGNHCNFINLTDCLLECFDYRDADECHLMVADSKQVAWPLVLVLDRLVEQLPSLTKREILQRLLDCYRDRYCSDDFSVASEFIGFFKQSALDAMEIINTIGRLNSAGELW